MKKFYLLFALFFTLLSCSEERLAPADASVTPPDTTTPIDPNKPITSPPNNNSGLCYFSTANVEGINSGVKYNTKNQVEEYILGFSEGNNLTYKVTYGADGNIAKVDNGEATYNYKYVSGVLALVSIVDNGKDVGVNKIQYKGAKISQIEYYGIENGKEALEYGIKYLYNAQGNVTQLAVSITELGIKDVVIFEGVKYDNKFTRFKNIEKNISQLSISFLDIFIFFDPLSLMDFQNTNNCTEGKFKSVVLEAIFSALFGETLDLKAINGATSVPFNFTYSYDTKGYPTKINSVFKDTEGEQKSEMLITYTCK